MIRLQSILILLMVGLITAGCGNRTELNDLGIATATGFDRKTESGSLPIRLLYHQRAVQLGRRLVDLKPP